MKRAKKSSSAVGRVVPPRAPNEEVAFEHAMHDMAADPQIQAECKAIQREFAQFELDGLGTAESAASLSPTPPLR